MTWSGYARHTHRSSKEAAVRTILLALALLAVACGAQGEVLSLEVGTCFDDPEDASAVSEVPIVDCDEPHDNEVFAVFTLPGSAFPGAAELRDDAVEGCSDRFGAYVGEDYLFSELLIGAFWPTEVSWEEADDREVICYLYASDGPLVGSQRGSTG